jgi:Fructose-bisphosphate aldolase class-II
VDVVATMSELKDKLVIGRPRPEPVAAGWTSSRGCTAVPAPLVLHGSSGVPDDDLAAAVAAGMTKVNVATQLNKVFTRAVRDYLAAAPDVVDTCRYLGAGRQAVVAKGGAPPRGAGSRRCGRRATTGIGNRS